MRLQQDPFQETNINQADQTMSGKAHILLSIILISGLISCVKESTETVITPLPSPEMGYEQGVMLVKFTDEMISFVEDDLCEGSLATKSSDLDLTLRSLGVQRMERVFPHAGEFEGRTRREGLHKWYKLTLSEETSVTKAAGTLEDYHGFEYVEPVRKIRNHAFNDLGIELWGLNNTDYKGADVNVQKVWERYTVGNPDVIVAVVDGGIDLTHEDLAANCLSSGHINTTNMSSPIEADSHGTHVAGTIAAVSNNGKGIAGIAGGNSMEGKSGVSLLSCQIFSSKGLGGNSSLAIKWGADHGAVISQNSWGYNFDFNYDGVLSDSELEYARQATIDRVTKEAVDYFIKYAGCDDYGNQLPDSPMKGGVVIFAAGNDGIGNGVPANYEPIIAVGAVTKNGRKANYSNYGNWVDIAAPGHNIYSTMPGNGYQYLSGTSMACPHVSGVAALVVSYCGGPGFTNKDLEEKLTMSANRTITPPSDNIGGLVNAYDAVRYGEKGVPGEVKDLKLSAISNKVSITCTVTEDSDGEPNDGYLVIFGTEMAGVDSATHEDSGTAEKSYFKNDRNTGENLEMMLEDLEFETSYYIKIYAKSREGKYSQPTMIQKITTKKNNPPELELAFDSYSGITAGKRLEINVIASDIDGHSVDIRHEPGSDAESLVKVDEGLWKLIISYRAEHGEFTSSLTASDEYGLETTKTFTYRNETKQ